MSGSLGRQLQKCRRADRAHADVSVPWSLYIAASRRWLRIISQILPNLEVAAWGGLEAAEVLPLEEVGAGAALKQQHFGGLSADFCLFLPWLSLLHGPRGPVFSISFGWGKRRCVF